MVMTFPGLTPLKLNAAVSDELTAPATTRLTELNWLMATAAIIWHVMRLGTPKEDFVCTYFINEQYPADSMHAGGSWFK